MPKQGSTKAKEVRMDNSNSDHRSEHRDPERCKRCGGDCCRLYTGIHLGVSVEVLPICHRIESSGYSKIREKDLAKIDIKPNFLPFLAHSLGGEQYRAELLAKGIDPTYCEFFDREIGCRIDWEKRPIMCRRHRCPDWKHETC